jgi:hypothetical protein
MAGSPGTMACHRSWSVIDQSSALFAQNRCRHHEVVFGVRRIRYWVSGVFEIFLSVFRVLGARIRDFGPLWRFS